MRNVTTRIRALVGALGILVFASPLAAQAHHHRSAQLRFAATYFQRNTVGPRYGPAFRRPGWRARAAWAYGPMAPRWRGRMWMRPVPRRGWGYARPAYRPLRRPWRRAWIGARYWAR